MSKLQFFNSNMTNSTSLSKNFNFEHFVRIFYFRYTSISKDVRSGQYNYALKCSNIFKDGLLERLL